MYMNKLLPIALIISMAASGMAYAQDDAKSYGSKSLKEALAKLPEAKATAFRDAMAQARKNNDGMKDQMKKQRGELNAIMTAPTFDKAAYIAKSAELQASKDKMHANMSEAFANAVAGLSQDERKQLADAMHKRGKRWHKDGEKPAATGGK
jgi:uncharacterized membrane protein